MSITLIDWCPEPDGMVDISIIILPFLVGMLFGYVVHWIMSKRKRGKRA